MNNGWPRVILGDFLQLSIDAVPVNPAKSYQMAGVYSFGRGLFSRDALIGSNTTYKYLHRLNKDDFVLSQPKGWEGALARVSDHYEGRFLSPVFPTFRADPHKLDIAYLEWYCKQSRVWEELRLKARGIGARRESILPSQLLSLELPLPPLAEQRRIVARIEELAAKIEEARELRKEAIKDVELLVAKARDQLLDNEQWSIQHLESILVESPRNGLSPQPEAESGGRPMLRINAVSSSPSRYVDLTACKMVDVADEIARPFVIKSNDVFIVRYNGDINRVAKAAIYKAEGESNVVYPDKLMRLRANQEKMVPDFLVYALGAESVRRQIEELGKTTAGQIGVSGTDAKSFRIPVPPLREQQNIVAHLDALQVSIESLKNLQSETSAELDALLPSILDKAFKGEL